MSEGSTNVSGTSGGAQTSAAVSSGTEGNSQGKSQSSGTTVASDAGQNESGSSDASRTNAPGTPEPTQDPNLWTVKVHGEDRTFDIRDPKQADVVRRFAQKAIGADKRFEEASAKEKKAMVIFEALKTDPLRVLKALGHDVDKLSKQQIQHQIAMAQMDDKDRAIYERDQKLAVFQQEEDARKAKIAQDHKTELENKYRVHYDKEITDALNTSGLPRTDYTAQRTAAYLLQAKKMGYKEATAKDVMETVRKDYINDFRTFFGTASIDQVEQIAGKEWMKKVRESDIARLSNPNQGQFAKTPDAKPRQRDTAPKAMNWNEYQKELERRVKS